MKTRHKKIQHAEIIALLNFKPCRSHPFVWDLRKARRQEKSCRVSKTFLCPVCMAKDVKTILLITGKVFSGESRRVISLVAKMRYFS